MDQSTRETYLAKLKAQFPELSYERAELVTYGWDHDVLVLDDRLVFRFPKSAQYLNRLGAEIRLTAYLLPRLPVAIPHYTYVAEAYAFGGYEKIAGVEMRGEVFAQLTAESQAAIAVEIGAFLSALHQVPPALLQEFGYEPTPEGPRWSVPQTQSVLQALRQDVFAQLAQDEIRFIEAQFADYLALSCDVALVPIHRDLTGDHILVDPDVGCVAGVIDFADAQVNDPALDFAGLWAFGERFVKVVLDCYTGAIDADFLARSRFPAVMNVAGYMARLVGGEPLPVTFDALRGELGEVMASGLRV
jgi:aminoglycoside 2''-phosphotransferase